MLLSPAGVHFKQCLSPEMGFVAAGAGVDGEDGGEVVVGFGEGEAA